MTTNATMTPIDAGRAVRAEWAAAHRVVIKVGSALLVNSADGTIKTEWLGSLLDDLADLKKSGKEVILVTSGAIALGRQVLGLRPGPLALEEAQAAAATGQIALAHAYRELGQDRGLLAAQILVTLGDTEERRRYLNARQTIETLLRLGALPIVNENDSVATNEIRYGDNDRLSARVASMASADCLILLSDIDGLYTAPPHLDATARRLDVVDDITPEIEAMAGDAATELSRGGMRTKIEAAKIARAAGTHMVIMSGKELSPLSRLAAGETCTWFPAPSDPTTARQRWITGQLQPTGMITIDAGAEHALFDGNSLLPAGVTAIDGAFDRGDVVVVVNAQGEEVARGLIAYTSRNARLIAGKQSRDIAAILGYEGRAELIHRDNMVMKRS